MDTKWKSRIGMIGWLVLFTFGVSGIMTSLINEYDYHQSSYFKTSKFQDQIGILTEYIDAFEISYMPKEEMKSAITVSKKEIEERRNLNGNLTEQVRQIEAQYRSRIEEAKANDDQKVADIYIKERDKKIDEVTKNFESDEKIKNEIISEKEERIDEYFNELEKYREDYETYQEAFVYYLKNKETGEVYTNLATKNSNFINDENMLFIQSYPTKKQEYLEIKEEPLVWGFQDVVDLPRTESKDIYEGKIAVSKDAPDTNIIMVSYHSFDDQRIVFWIHTVSGMIALIASVLIGKRIRIISKIAPRKWQSKYNKIPLDFAVLLQGIFALTSIALIDNASNLYFNLNTEDLIFNLLFLTLFIGLTMMQAIYLYSRLKNISSEKGVLKNTVIARVLQTIKNAFLGVVNTFRNAFLNRRVGTQVFLILTIVFLFGLGTALNFIDEDFLAFFLPAFFFIGVPLFVLIVKRIGYFNQILFNTRALAKGEFEPDLKIIGKSVLAKLAGDINQMKYGVKNIKKSSGKK